MKAKLIKNDIGYHLWLNLETKEQEHIASDNPIIDNWGVDLRKYKLSKQNCDEIFGVVDVEKLAKEVLPNDDTTGTLSKQKGFVIGFNKAIELNKMFTLEDIRRAMSAGLSIGYGRQFEIENKSIEIEAYIQSLQQPTEIEVMIEMVKTPDAMFQFHDVPYSTPKLDSEGCLIIKRITTS